MTGRTHDLAAFTLLHIVFVTVPIPTMTVATAVAGLGGCFIGGLFPDIDQPTADLYRRLPAGNIIGRIVAPILGSHRMISHSIIGILLIGYGSNWLLAKLVPIILVDMIVVWWCFLIGSLSHIIMDMFTRDGVPLLFPFPWKFGIPPISRLRMKTGGIIEKGIIFPLMMALNAYLVYEFYPKYLTFFQQYVK